MSRITRAKYGALPLLAVTMAATPSTASAADPSPIPQTAPVIAEAADASPASKPRRLVRILKRRLVTTGESVTVRARALFPLRAELRVAGHRKPIAKANIDEPGERFRLQGDVDHGDHLLLTVRRTDGVDGSQTRKIGKVKQLRLRSAVASWYGPGLFGNRTACGHTLTTGLRGVAHKTLPCGTKLTLRYRGRTTQARVVDRGPFHGGREFDLTYATARAIGFSAVAKIGVSR